MAVSEQTDFGAGVYRGRKAPAASVFDAVNALIDDEGQLFKRGGSAYLTTSDAGAALLGLAQVYTPTTGDATIAWTATAIGVVSGTTWTSFGGSPVRAWARGVGVGDYWYAPHATTANRVVSYVGTAGVSGITYASVASVDALAAVGTPARLIIADGTKAWFTAPGNPSSLGATDYHELPSRARIKGADALGDAAILFTTVGVWAIENLSLDAVDAAGNAQHQVRRVSDIVGWGDPGITGYSGALVVPAVDDVYLFSLSSPPRPISDSIRPLYRGYVKAGYQPGTASVHRGHYKLPIMNGNTVVDVLVCRLDRPYQTPGGRVFYPWTRWAGHSAGGAYAEKIGDSSRTPKLYAVSGQRILDLTSTLDAVNTASEADGTTHTFTVIGSDNDTGPGIRPNTAEKVRFTYEAAGSAPSITVSTAVGLESASFTAAVLKRGGGASDGTDYSAWRVGRKAERIRWKFECSSAVTNLLLRRAEWTIRQAGQS